MDKAKRRLAAVMFTDIVGYSKLMNEDEGRAMQLLENYDNIGEKCFSELGGRLIKKIGDADFVEFSSALDAVSCAINLQKKLKDLEEDSTSKGPNSVTNNAVFVGSTSELQKLLKQGFLNNNNSDTNNEKV